MQIDHVVKLEIDSIDILSCLLVEFMSKVLLSEFFDNFAGGLTILDPFDFQCNGHFELCYFIIITLNSKIDLFCPLDIVQVNSFLIAGNVDELVEINWILFFRLLFVTVVVYDLFSEVRGEYFPKPRIPIVERSAHVYHLILELATVDAVGGIICLPEHRQNIHGY